MTETFTSWNDLKLTSAPCPGTTQNLLPLPTSLGNGSYDSLDPYRLVAGHLRLIPFGPAKRGFCGASSLFGFDLATRRFLGF